MAQEIERKWLIDASALPFELQDFEHHHIEQSYVCFSPQIRIRAIDDASFVLTVKGEPAGEESALVREEFEVALSEASYRALKAKTEGKVLAKTRYFVSAARAGVDAAGASDDRVFEIDVYEGDLAGLAVAEMEFASVAEAEAFPTPSWALSDVSEDARYFNVVMAQSL